MALRRTRRGGRRRSADSTACGRKSTSRFPSLGRRGRTLARALILIRADLLHRGFGGGVVPVLRHEWVHLAWGHHAGANDAGCLPLWAEEGLAEDIGGGVSIDLGSTLDLAVVFDRLLDFHEPRDSLPRRVAAAGRARVPPERVLDPVRGGAAGWASLRSVLGELLRERPRERPFPEESPFAAGRPHPDGRSVGRVAGRLARLAGGRGDALGSTSSSATSRAPSSRARPRRRRCLLLPAAPATAPSDRPSPDF